MKTHLITVRRGLCILALILAVQILCAETVLAATFAVTSTADSGAGSLRQAILDANSSPGPDLITFNIPKSDPGWSLIGSQWLIQPLTVLPNLTGTGTTIDGFTQTANQGDTNPLGPEIWLDGVHLGGTDWLLTVDSHENKITGLAITRGGGGAIRIRATNLNLVVENYIGTDPAGDFAWGNGTGIALSAGATTNTIQGNVISGNAGDGIHVSGAGTDNNLIVNNIVGLSSTGVAAVPNGGHGILVTGGAQSNLIINDGTEHNIISGNDKSGVTFSGAGTDWNLVAGAIIGTDQSGTAAVGNKLSGVILKDGAKHNGVQGNLISGNGQNGVNLEGAGTGENFVRSNIIGANKDVTKVVPNGWHNVAIYNGASSNWIGTISPPWGNIIVGAGWSGVAIFDSNQNRVMHNSIGTDETGSATNLGNGYYGVHVEGMQNTIGISNTIAFNALDGIRVDGKTVAAQSNTITRNSVYYNGGSGIELVNNGNNLLSAPTISNATCLVIEGAVCAGCEVEIFSDTAWQGREFEGATTANAILPAFTWNGTATGPGVTATATDGQGNTSKFSLPVVQSCHPPVAVISVQPSMGVPGTAFRFDASASNDVESPTSALEVRWDWHSDGTYDTAWSTVKVAEHTFVAQGEHGVRVMVRDSDGLTGTAGLSVMVQQPEPLHNAPTATFTVDPLHGPPGTKFRFDASKCSDLEDPTSALEVRWDWEDDGTYDTPWSKTKIIDHSFNTAGDHSVRLVVRDTGGDTDSTSRVVKMGEFPQVFVPLLTD